MLSLFGSDKAPGVEHVQLYRDDERADAFYMVPSRPTIARDEDGDPLIHFVLYARDVDRLPATDLEVQRGLVQLTTQVAVSPEDEQKILAYLRTKVPAGVQPSLSYPPEFVEGTVRFTLLTEDLVPKIVGSAQPSLQGTNLASFSASLNQEGSQVVHQLLQTGSLLGVVHYDGLKFLARIPAVTIRVRGDRQAFFNEVVTKWTEIHGWHADWDWFWWRWQVWYWYAEQHTSLSQFKSDTQTLTVEIDDREFRDADADAEMTKQLEDMVLELLTNKVIPSLFEAIPPPSEEQRKNKDSVVQTVSGSVDLTFSRSALVEVTVNPNAELTDVITPAELASHMTFVDLSDPYFRELSVNIHANVDFTNDPVFGLKVFLDYDQQDELRNLRVKKGKEFLFTSGEEAKRFRQIMARAADKSVKDSYSYWSQLIYKDTGETIRVPASGAEQTRETELVISYRRLGFIKVALRLARLSEGVKAAQIHMRYPQSRLPSAETTVELTRDNPTGTFFTYTGHSGQPGPYEYQIAYIMESGDRIDLPTQTSLADSLTVPDPFERTLQTRFNAEADFTVVQEILVDARYDDQDGDVHGQFHAELHGNGDSAEWTLGIRDPQRLEFEYDVAIVFKDGSRETQPTARRLLGQTVPVGVGAVDALEVMIIPEIDFTVHKFAVVSLEYVDAEHDIRQSKSLTFRQGGANDATWRVLLRDKTRRSYRYRMQFLGVLDADDVVVDWQETSDPVLIVQPA